MKGLSLRISAPGDEPELKSLWNRVFGDDMAYIDGFFRAVYEPGCAVIAEKDGMIASAVYVFGIGELADGAGNAVPASVSYAFATRPEMRSRGYGTETAAAALRKSFEAGFCAATICPAEDSLFGYYSGRIGYDEWFYENRFRCEVTEKCESADVEELSAAEYARVREGLLRDRAHIRFSDRMLGYQHRLCRNSGGGMYAFRTDGASGCFAAECAPDGELLIKELLLREGDAAAAAVAVAACLGKRRALVRTPSDGGQRCAMLRMNGNTRPERGAKDPWYGFMFD